MHDSWIKAVCFDYYGTLVDAGKPFDDINTWFASFLHRRKRPDLQKKFSRFFRRRLAVYQARACFVSGEKMLDECYFESCKHCEIEPDFQGFTRWMEDAFILPPAFEDAMEALASIKTQCQVGLISNADNRFLSRSIDQNSFQFDFIVSSETTGANKPNSAIFRVALDLVPYLPSEILMVGDSITEDILPAQALGMRALWLNRHRQDCPDSIQCIHALVEIKEHLSKDHRN